MYRGREWCSVFIGGKKILEKFFDLFYFFSNELYKRTGTQRQHKIHDSPCCCKLMKAVAQLHKTYYMYIIMMICSNAFTHQRHDVHWFNTKTIIFTLLLYIYKMYLCVHEGTVNWKRKKGKELCVFVLFFYIFSCLHVPYLDFFVFIY